MRGAWGILQNLFPPENPPKRKMPPPTGENLPPPGENYPTAERSLLRDFKSNIFTSSKQKIAATECDF